MVRKEPSPSRVRKPRATKKKPASRKSPSGTRKKPASSRKKPVSSKKTTSRTSKKTGTRARKTEKPAARKKTTRAGSNPKQTSQAAAPKSPKTAAPEASASIAARPADPMIEALRGLAGDQAPEEPAVQVLEAGPAASPPPLLPPTSRVERPITWEEREKDRRLLEIDQYLRDLKRLERFEAEAETDLRRAERYGHWVPTDYEQHFLPGLRLAGIPDKTRIVLQNSADLHIHTEWSDGDLLDKVLDAAVAARLDVIAITDHDEIEGALEARRRVHERRLKIAVVPGTEVSTRDGHVGALFVTRRFPKGLSAEETVRLIHEAGGIAIAHHPYAPRLIERILGVKLGVGDLIQEIPFDAVECTNAVPGYGTRYNIAARDRMEEHHVRVAMTGSSDAHTARLVGKGRTWFAGNRGVVSLRDSIQYGFCQGTEGYWKFREKLVYRITLWKNILRNFLNKRGSVQ